MLGPCVARRREDQLSARSLERIGLGSCFARDRERRDLLPQQPQRVRVGAFRLRRRRGHEVDRIALRELRMFRQRARRHRSGAGRPSLPEQIALGAKQGVRFVRKLRGGFPGIGRQRPRAGR